MKIIIFVIVDESAARMVHNEITWGDTIREYKRKMEAEEELESLCIKCRQEKKIQKKKIKMAVYKEPITYRKHKAESNIMLNRKTLKRSEYINLLSQPKTYNVHYECLPKKVKIISKKKDNVPSRYLRICMPKPQKLIG